jgi:hypothetical protein
MRPDLAVNSFLFHIFLALPIIVCEAWFPSIGGTSEAYRDDFK